MESILSFIQSIIGFLLAPITRIFTASVGIVSLVLGAIANPEGAVNLFLCKIIDLIAAVFPSTPPEMKISYLLAGLGESVPMIGSGIVFSILQTLLGMMVIVLFVKLYKLIPFKAT